jgi:hypothetical protein|tara:strand:- start:282 stop:464 length:183 start_codon:yes stop_codon:yes gene_type:complete
MIKTVTKNYSIHTNEFCSYQVTYVNSNKVKSVPLDEANTDYQAIQEWAAIDGNNIIDPGA